MKYQCILQTKPLNLQLQNKNIFVQNYIRFVPNTTTRELVKTDNILRN